MAKKQSISNEMKQNAYEELIREIQSYQSGQDYQIIYRSLSLTRIEFMALQSFSKFEQGKNALKVQYCQKTIAFLDSELALFREIIFFFRTIHSTTNI